MFSAIIKNTIIYFMCFYSYNKISRFDIRTHYHYLLYGLFAIILSSGTYIIKLLSPELSYFVPAFCLFICIVIYTKSFSHITFCISLTAYALNLLIFQLVALIISSISVMIFRDSIIANILFPIFFTSILYPFAIITIFKSKRFSGEISKLSFNNMISWNTIICFVVITLFTFEQLSVSVYSKARYSSVSAIAICLCVLTIWWRKQITKTYRDKLRLLELKSLRAAKTENEAYILKLEAENKRLGIIIHKDNRIVNAMADSVCEYLSASENLATADLQSKGQSLSDEINSIRTYRQELLCQEPICTTWVPQTNHAGIDAIISFMIKEASAYKISLKFHFDKDFFSAKFFTATDIDLVHLLSDLLENAIIATRHANGKSIELSLQILNGTPSISVSDSGIPFEPTTLMKLGLCEASTHTDEGGTGIGLMDIWTFKKKYQASFVIEELDDSVYSKRVSLLFDNKNKYLIISNRYKQISSTQTRSDLLVISDASNGFVGLTEE